MPAPEQSKRNVRIDSEKYLIRTIETDDASDRWAGWMSDPEVMHMLNLRARTWKKADVLDYIKTFDQQSSLLLGIFEKQGGTHIGVFTVDINQVRSQFLVNLLIGEPEYRNKHVTSSIAMPFHEYFFETLGLNMAVASVLGHNAPMIHYLKKNGWKLDRTVKHAKKSNADGAMLDVCLFSLSRDAREKDRLVRSLDEPGPGEAAGAVEQHVWPHQIPEPGASRPEQVEFVGLRNAYTDALGGSVKDAETDDDPLMFVPERSISSPPTQAPLCQLAPAWKPQTEPLELIPDKVIPEAGALPPKMKSVNGSRPQP